ncbi:hypothetical protein AVEN_170358-1 [Araneus ventricosus]|uniref:Uncharacterized protein n=1 Tax=Araneus ventricosus TaxID=182803 RepID=A0A4Y2CA74_ARAVE|nr:hypothetical protein AVEN_170358-1 [Araneus ventricosus]
MILQEINSKKLETLSPRMVNCWVKREESQDFNQFEDMNKEIENRFSAVPVYHRKNLPPSPHSSARAISVQIDEHPFRHNG